MEIERGKSEIEMREMMQGIALSLAQGYKHVHVANIRLKIATEIHEIHSNL